MKTGGAILAGLLAGVLVAAGLLVAFVLVGPDPIGLRPTPSPTVAVTPSPTVAATPSPTVAATPSPTVAATASPSASAGPSASPAASASASAGAPTGSDAGQTGFHIGEPAPPLVVPQLGGGTIDLSTLRGKAV
jgi:cytoskeletal protein RodZ